MEGTPAGAAQLLRFLSRFEITVEQANSLYDEAMRDKKRWRSTDHEILQNPYRVMRSHDMILKVLDYSPLTVACFPTTRCG